MSHKRASSRRVTFAVLVVMSGLYAPTASGLQIIGRFLEKPGPPPEEVFGGGNLPDIFDAAAGLWERAIEDDHTVTIDYTWGNLGTDLLGIALVGSTEARSPTGFINFNDRGGFPWYFDPDPNDDAEFGSFLSTSQLLGGSDGEINVGRQFFATSGDAAFGFDAFYVALHEIGHILGLVTTTIPFAVDAEDGDLDLTAPLRFAGAELPTTPTGGGHLALFDPVMNPFIDFASRKLLSEADILGVAQVNGYTQLNLDPLRVPEPGTTVLWLVAAAGVLGVGRGAA